MGCTAQEKLQSISRGYYKNKLYALLDYDITNRNSFNNKSNLMKECKNNGPRTIYLVQVGNRRYLEDKRQITYEECEEFDNRNDIQFLKLLL